MEGKTELKIDRRSGGNILCLLDDNILHAVFDADDVKEVQKMVSRVLRVLRVLEKVSTCNVIRVGEKITAEDTPLRDQDDVSLQAYSRMIEEPQGVFVLTRGWDKAAVKKLQRDLGRLLTAHCQLKNGEGSSMKSEATSVGDFVQADDDVEDHQGGEG